MVPKVVGSNPIFHPVKAPWQIAGALYSLLMQFINELVLYLNEYASCKKIAILITYCLYSRIAMGDAVLTEDCCNG